MQRIKDKKILITGASRFPANKFIKYFDMQKIPIIGVDIKFPSFNPQSLRFYETDSYFSNIESIIKKEKIDTVIHLPFDFDIYSEMHPYNRNNYIRFERLFKIYSNGNIKRLFLFSSNHVYGVDLSSRHRFTEEDVLISSSQIAYINDLLVIERNIIQYLSHNKADGLFLMRLAPLYHSFSEDILIRFFKKTPIFYSISRRNPEFQLLYVYDLINYVINAMANGNGGIYNIATSDTILLSEIANYLNKPFVYVPEHLIKSVFYSVKWLLRSEVYNNELIDLFSYNSLMSIDRARRDLKYEPEYSCRDLVDNITFFD